MSILWPASLILLLVIPFAIAGYIIFMRRRRKFAIRYSSLSLVSQAASHQSWLRRHAVFIIFLLAITSLAFGTARPTATVMIPSNKATIVLALDVSLSMCSTDIAPNRLEVAKDAAQAFIQNHNSGQQIGLVAFAGFAELIQPPTTDTQALHDAVENLTTARRTAIGSAILRSIDTIAEVDDRIAPIDNVFASPGTPKLSPSEIENSPHIIVLLTDGASNAGPYPLTAATLAAERGIRVYTIGYGTASNQFSLDCGDGFDQDFLFRGFSFGRQINPQDFRLQIDEGTLKQVAEMTGGTYYYAASANELEDVFQNLPTFLVAIREKIEISVFFTAFAAIMIMLAMFLSFRWYLLG
ncbi:MAG TPA: VWA domain-containing protein [Anaerolineales bacterium]|nr:VWA domain-containing protein [Anaerolineales bacterium]